MSVPLPIELRERIVAAVQEGMTWMEAAETFRVGRATVNRLMRRLRELGSLEPLPHAGGQWHRIPDDRLPLLRELVEAHSDATIAQLRDLYCERTATTVSTATVGRALRERLRLSLKKSPSSTRSRLASGSRRRDSSTAKR